MKKIIAVFLVVMFCVSTIGVSAASVPKFMEKTYNNYTADYKFSMSISNVDEVIAFLEELEMPDEVNNFVDLKALIESLYNVSSVMNVQAEISDDFRRVKASATFETDQNIVFNSNFDVSYSAKMGVWMEMDVDKKKLVLIYLTPLNEKYAVIDFEKDVPAEVSETIFSMYDKMFNREFMDKYSKDVIDIAIKYADVSLRGNTCTVKFNNDAFIKVIDDVLDYTMNMMSDFSQNFGEEDMEVEDIPSLEGIKLLGDKGIVCTYKLNGNNIKSVSEKFDISVCISDIYEKTTGETWEYESEGNINFKLENTVDVKKIGTTKVSMPKLTEENSFNIAELFFAEEEEYYYEEDEYNKYSYVYGYTETDTFDGARYYFPLRFCVEDAYYDCSVITYDKGVITITTDCGKKEEDINVTLKVGEDTATVNGVTYEDFGAFKEINGSVYASVEFYEKCLGWTLDSLSKDLLDGSLSFGMNTTDMGEY